MKIYVKKDERALQYKKGDYVKMLKPGEHTFLPFMDYSHEIYNLNEQFLPPKDLNIYAGDESLMEALHLLEVQDNELVLHFEDNRFKDVLAPGKYAFWNILKKHTFTTCDINDPVVDDSINKAVLADPRLAGFITRHYVEAHEKGLLLIDGTFRELLGPGNYNFWNGSSSVEIIKADMRQLQLDMTGQEIMTEDKVTLRVNFICHYRIADPVKTLLEIKTYEEQLYIIMQLILREYIGTLKLDELLQKKEEIGTYTLSRLNKKSGELGIEFIYAGVKDIILPGEIRTILNSVIEAEKKAQATIITRREETASTRSLLNTAKLMEDNPLLYKLKEMEYIERISEKISSISIDSGGKLLEQIRHLFRGEE